MEFSLIVELFSLRDCVKVAFEFGISKALMESESLVAINKVQASCSKQGKEKKSQ